MLRRQLRRVAGIAVAAFVAECAMRREGRRGKKASTTRVSCRYGSMRLGFVRLVQSKSGGGPRVGRRPPPIDSTFGVVPNLCVHIYISMYVSVHVAADAYFS
eukprot:GHVU01038218.1.p1 GENE.GHVU01038218.1~~GHVU01038218.1.p1  ORF type:complete len:102 (-),score=3.74 GHVU01038218.1:370-675(-)